MDTRATAPSRRTCRRRRQRHLVPDVAHEVAHHARTELLRGQRQRQDRDGEHHADDRDDRGRDGDEDLALGVGAPRADPDRERQVAVVRRHIDLERRRRTAAPRRRPGGSERPRTSCGTPPNASSAAGAGPSRCAPAAASTVPVGAGDAHAASGPCAHRARRLHARRHDGKNRGRWCRLAPSSSSARSAANGYCPTSGLASSARTTSSRLPEQAACTARRS